MIQIQDLLRKYLTPVKAPRELDREVRKMVLEQRVIGQWLHKADNCAKSDETPLSERLEDVDCKEREICTYVTPEMIEQLWERSDNKRVCVFQSAGYHLYTDSNIPYFSCMKHRFQRKKERAKKQEPDTYEV